MIEMSPKAEGSTSTTASATAEAVSSSPRLATPPPPSPSPAPAPPASPPSRVSTLPLRLGLPVRRAELIIVPHSAAGETVIKDPISGAYYHLGPEESLLLRALNGRNTAAKICRGFEKQFGQPLTREDLDDFIELADSMN